MPNESQAYNEQLNRLQTGRMSRSQRRQDNRSNALCRVENNAITRINDGLANIDISALPVVDRFLPTDYQTKSSSIQETEFSDADLTLQAIKKQRATAKIVKENIALASDISSLKSDVAKLISSEVNAATNLEKINANIANLNSAVESTKIAEINLNSKRFERESTETLSGLIAQKLIAQQNEARAKTAQIEARTAITIDSSNYNVNTVEI